jgi:hypothetical protein
MSNLRKTGFGIRAPQLALLLSVLLTAHGISISAESKPLMTCTLDRPVVGVDQSVGVSAWVSKEQLIGRSVRWLIPIGGVLQGDGLDATWTFSGVVPNVYRATAVLVEGDVELDRCSVVVVVEQHVEERGPRLLTGRALLLAGQSETSDYGYYSYLVIPSPPEPVRRNQSLRIIETFLREAPQILNLEAYSPRKDINIGYIPVTRPADAGFNGPIAERDYAAAAEWILRHYDHARALVLMKSVSKVRLHGGPFIVSYAAPLGRGGISDETRLHLQDFTHVPGNLVTRLVEGYFDRAGQTSWAVGGIEGFAEQLVILFSVVAEGADLSKSAVDDWLSWGAEVSEKLDKV